MVRSAEIDVLERGETISYGSINAFKRAYSSNHRFIVFGFPKRSKSQEIRGFLLTRKSMKVKSEIMVNLLGRRTEHFIRSFSHALISYIALFLSYGRLVLMIENKLKLIIAADTIQSDVEALLSVCTRKKGKSNEFDSFALYSGGWFSEIIFKNL